MMPRSSTQWRVVLIALMAALFISIAPTRVPAQAFSAWAATPTSDSGSCFTRKFCLARTDLDEPTFTIPNVGGLTGANMLYTDSLTGETGVRISDYHTLGATPAQANYQVEPGGSAEISFMNRNDDRFYISDSGGYLELFTFNPSSLQATRMYASSFPSSNGIRLTVGTGGEWSYTQPYTLYAGRFGSAVNNNPQIWNYDFTSTITPPSGSVLFDFSSNAACSDEVLARKASWMDPPTVSADDQTFATAVAVSSQGGQGTGTNIVVWNRTKGCIYYDTATGTVGGQWGSTGTITLNGSSSIETFKIHNVRISLDGNWVKISRQGCVSGQGANGSCLYTVYLWNIGTKQVYAAKIQNSGHSAMGYTHVVNDATTPYQQSIQTASVASLGANTCLADCGSSPTPPVQSGWDTHPSWPNAQSSDSNPMCGSSFVTNQSTPLQAWNNEILCWDPSGSGTVYRLGWTYATMLTVDSDFSGSEAIGPVSSDGKFMAFTSDWGGQLGSTSGGESCTTSPYNCRNDVFILQLK